MPMLERPFELAGKRLRNRIVHVSITTLAARDGKVMPGQIQYHSNRARGGAAASCAPFASLRPLSTCTRPPTIEARARCGRCPWTAR